MNFKRLTEKQLECLGYYALLGLIPPRLFHASTTSSLVKKGFLIKIERRDGNFVIHDYEMPESVRIGYCSWCSETVEEEV